MSVDVLTPEERRFVEMEREFTTKRFADDRSFDAFWLSIIDRLVAEVERLRRNGTQRGICRDCAWWTPDGGPYRLSGCTHDRNPLRMEYAEAPWDFGCNQWEAKR